MCQFADSMHNVGHDKCCSSPNTLISDDVDRYDDNAKATVSFVAAGWPFLSVSLLIVAHFGVHVCVAALLSICFPLTLFPLPRLLVLLLYGVLLLSSQQRTRAMMMMMKKQPAAATGRDTRKLHKYKFASLM